MTEGSALRLAKAARAIHAAEVLLTGGEPEFAAGRAYYAMFYTAQALLWDKGLKPRTHSGTHHLLWEHFIKPGLLERRYHESIANAFDQRLEADYGYVAITSPEDVSELLAQARDFLAAARRLLATPE